MNPVSIFPWNQAIGQIIDQSDVHPLAGSDLLIGWDGRRMHGYSVDCFICTNQLSRAHWNLEREVVRKQFLQDDRGIEYKKIDSDTQCRGALEPALRAAEKMNGVCIVTLTDDRLEKLSIADAAKGLKETRGLLENGEPIIQYTGWKAAEFARAMRMVNLLTLLVAKFSTPKQGVHWACDEDNIWGNEGQIQDMHRMLKNFSGLVIPHELGRLSCGTYATDGLLNLEAKDFACIADCVAGGVSDTVALVETGGEVDPIRFPSKNGGIPKAEVVAKWFWDVASTPLVRIAVRIKAEGSTHFSVGQVRMTSTITTVACDELTSSHSTSQTP
jgi:hypothetical protein